ncbi:hypothetical protein XAP412_960090 [Xanthomonas phaseoli pv. phaseoli]|uniref:Uncharacterized protein n=1 Tax=Xanthomonas campestris pv. phaseoli TaxID=317013 RepID=A0ABY1TZB2_XANCH|nr:hypothetical protein XAP6984_990093 [Xanthomonas phaseoli pv. phaseoli]SON91861.1 hypothetical protein XAP412_960090 [Xanthomonas phaseoli pv. phaseoli]SOO30223.1 hypothetical protein XAP6164_4180002 [Xanthomonas phaseoli pv. phaseoli]
MVARAAAKGASRRCAWCVELNGTVLEVLHPGSGSGHEEAYSVMPYRSPRRSWDWLRWIGRDIRGAGKCIIRTTRWLVGLRATVKVRG